MDACVVYYERKIIKGNKIYKRRMVGVVMCTGIKVYMSIIYVKISVY